MNISHYGDGCSSVGDGRSSVGDSRSSVGDGRSSVGDGHSSVGYSARYTLLCCGFDSRRHTQILYKENRKKIFPTKNALIDFKLYYNIHTNT
jgi:hypothetical protein